jgi:hypothetical protein
VISLIVMIIVGWLLARWLLREPVYFEPPAPPVQITIHLHQPQIVLTLAEPRARRFCLACCHSVA